MIAVPVRNTQGGITGCVTATRDVTALHAAVSATARFEGAVMTVRTAAHELNQGLQVLASYCDILTQSVDPAAQLYVEEMGQTTQRLGAIISRLQRIARFEEIETTAGPALNLGAATGKDD